MFIKDKKLQEEILNIADEFIGGYYNCQNQAQKRAFELLEEYLSSSWGTVTYATHIYSYVKEECWDEQYDVPTAFGSDVTEEAYLILSHINSEGFAW